MSRRLVIPDIHGCSGTFKVLVEKVSLTKNDILFLLGDYIDRGPDNCGVLDYIMNLQSKGFDVRPLRGNHEHEMLLAFSEYDKPTFRFYARRFRSFDLLTTDGKIKEPYFEFMNSLPFFFELPDYYLVHGGIDFTREKPFDDLYRLLILRKTYYDVSKAKNRKVVYGHQPTNIEDIKKAIDEHNTLIPLDNGCIYTKPHKIYDYTKMGNLLCFDLDSRELVIQKNIDPK